MQRTPPLNVRFSAHAIYIGLYVLCVHSII
jgi:hypothetical protein